MAVVLSAKSGFVPSTNKSETGSGSNVEHIPNIFVCICQKSCRFFFLLDCHPNPLTHLQVLSLSDPLQKVLVSLTDFFPKILFNPSLIDFPMISLLCSRIQKRTCRLSKQSEATKSDIITATVSLIESLNPSQQSFSSPLPTAFALSSANIHDTLPRHFALLFILPTFH
jgi:hypothetical protein